jgi:hypothetical protein
MAAKLEDFINSAFFAQKKAPHQVVLLNISVEN